MYLKEFMEKNEDIMLQALTAEELPAIAMGEAVLYVSLAEGRKPKSERAVLFAGYALTAGMTFSENYDSLYLVRSTAGGNPAMDRISLTGLAPDGNVILFRTRPMKHGDPRIFERFKHWENPYDTENTDN